METRISSRSTYFLKWVFPVIFLAFLAFFTFNLLQHSADPERYFLIPFFGLFGVFGFFSYRIFIWNLADSVVDHGAYLLVRRRGVEERIPMDNIMNVSYTQLVNPARITLRLVRPGALGSHVSFAPNSPLFSSAFRLRNKLAEQLMERAYAARTSPGGMGHG